jgi:hypothetical protein
VIGGQKVFVVSCSFERANSYSRRRRLYRRRPPQWPVCSKASIRTRRDADPLRLSDERGAIQDRRQFALTVRQLSLI